MSGETHPTPWQRKVLWNTITAISISVIALMIVILVWLIFRGLNILSGVLIPLALAAILAYLLDPAINYLRKHHSISRTTAISIVFFVIVLVLITILIWVVPLILQQLNSFITKFPEMVERLREIGSKLYERIADSSNNLQWAEVQQQFTEQIKTSGAGIARRIFDWAFSALTGAWGMLSFLFGLIVVPVYVFYFLRDKESIVLHWTDYLPITNHRIKQETVEVIQSINHVLTAFFRGQLLIMLEIGILTSIGFMIIGVDFGLLIGIAMGMLSIIPYLGIILGTAPAMLFAYAEHGPKGILNVLIVCVVVQTIDGFLIAPKIMGDKTGLHPVTVVISILVWTTLLGGLLGAILAVPLTAVLRVLMFRYVWRRQTPEQRSNAAPSAA